MYKLKNIGDDQRQIYEQGKWVILNPGESTILKCFRPSTDRLKVEKVKEKILIKNEVDKK